MKRKPPFDCLSCDCFLPSNENRPADGGVCHGGPPTASVIGMRPHPITQKPEAVTASYYSTVGPGDWCSFHPQFGNWRRSLPRIGASVLIGAQAPQAEDDEPALPGEIKRVPGGKPS